MSMQIYLIISVAVLLLIGLLVFLGNKNKTDKSFTPLAGVAFAFVIAGIVFGSNRVVGYSLMGIGIILAVIDAVKKSKKR